MATKAELEEQNAALVADMALIAERIRQEAIERSWCSDYDRIMREINTQTSAPHMQPRATEYTVVTAGQVTINFSDLKVQVESSGEIDEGALVEAVRIYLRDEVGMTHHYVADSMDTPVLTEWSEV
jgi:hypothetical protein